MVDGPNSFIYSSCYYPPSSYTRRERSRCSFLFKWVTLHFALLLFINQVVKERTTWCQSMMIDCDSFIYVQDTHTDTVKSDSRHVQICPKNLTSPLSLSSSNKWPQFVCLFVYLFYSTNAHPRRDCNSWIVRKPIANNVYRIEKRRTEKRHNIYGTKKLLGTESASYFAI